MKQRSTLYSCFRESPFFTIESINRAEPLGNTASVYYRDSSPFLIKSNRAVHVKKEEVLNIHDIYKLVTKDARLYQSPGHGKDKFLGCYVFVQLRLLVASRIKPRDPFSLMGV